MKVVGIVGSPRIGGNCELLTKIALEEIAKEGLETEVISLGGLRITPCDSCGACRNGKCHVEDDFQQVCSRMLEADGIIMSSPVWYGAASPQISALISRFYGVRGKPLKNKVGGPIVVARRAGKNFTFAQLMFFYMIQGMIVPGSSYWNVAIGRGKGDVLQDEEGVQTIRSFAQNVAWLIKKINTQ